MESNRHPHTPPDMRLCLRFASLSSCFPFHAFRLGRVANGDLVFCFSTSPEPQEQPYGRLGEASLPVRSYWLATKVLSLQSLGSDSDDHIFLFFRDGVGALNNGNYFWPMR